MNLRSLHNEINFLFSEALDSAREENTLDNLITEVHIRAADIYTGLADPDQFDQYLRQGIKTYSQYLRRHIITNPQIQIDQTLEEQYNWGILENCVHISQINHRIRQYREFISELSKIIRRAIRKISALYNSNRDLRTAYQYCCWCLFKYRDTPFYRTALRSYIENLYSEIDQTLQLQGFNNVPLTSLTTSVEAFINEKCNYLHFNLENNAALLITAFGRRILRRTQNRRQTTMTMNQDQLRILLDRLLGQNGLDITGSNQALTQAIQNMPGGGARELSLIKVDDFYGKDNEDPHEWLDQFKRAATANQWPEDRLLDITKGYLKGAAGDWVKAATAANANN